MRDGPLDSWEEIVRETAHRFPYPPTPDLAAGSNRKSSVYWRRWTATALVLACLAIAVMLAIPQARATILHVLRIGGVRIVTVPPSQQTTPSTVEALRSPSPTPYAQPSPSIAVTPNTMPTMAGTSSPYPKGETTLRRARKAVSFPIKLPTYPENLGRPDRVYLERFGGDVVVLVWLRPHSTKPLLTLYEMGPGVFAEKLTPPAIKTVRVKGRKAVWTKAPHMLIFLTSPDRYFGYQVKSNTLVWSEGQITYRLESNYSLSRSRRIAESLP